MVDSVRGGYPRRSRKLASARAELRTHDRSPAMSTTDPAEVREREPLAPESAELPVLAAIETHSIDFIPERERHGKIRQQGVFWFLSNTQTLSVALGFIGIALGLSIWWTIVAVLLGNAFGTVFMALHAS